MSRHVIPLEGGQEVQFVVDRVLGRRQLAELLEFLAPLAPHAADFEPRPAAVHQFLPAHLRLVFLLAESQGSTHTRLRRAWDAKSARSGKFAWPWISDSGLRTRVSELVSWGLVEASGAYGETPAGRPSRIWQLTGIAPTDVGRDALPVPGYAPEAREVLFGLRDEAGLDLTIRTQLEVAARVAGILA